ncbi:MAG: hypothetical protein WA474_00195 [Candidatus Sulfotelmatobacter sp.]
MFRSFVFRGVLAVAFGMVAGSSTFAASQQNQDGGQDKHSDDKHLDIQSSAGDLHVGNDADARKAGLPLYPGARLRHDEDNSNAANLSLFTEAFGVKLVIAKYDSDDAPGKVTDFYRGKLKKYGKVIECHTREHGGTHADFNDDDSKDEHSQPVKCEGDNTGPVTELKVGTEANQHVVAIEPKTGGGSSFALVYVHTRGKQGDI